MLRRSARCHAGRSASYLERARQVGPRPAARSAATTPLGSRGVSPAGSRQPSRGTSPAPVRRAPLPGAGQGPGLLRLRCCVRCCMKCCMIALGSGEKGMRPCPQPQLSTPVPTATLWGAGLQQRSRSADPQRPGSQPGSRPGSASRFDPTEYVRQQRDRQRAAADRLEEQRRAQRLQQRPSSSRPASRPQSLPASRPSSVPSSSEHGVAAAPVLLWILCGAFWSGGVQRFPTATCSWPCKLHLVGAGYSTPARSRVASRDPSVERGRAARDGSRERAALARSTERLRGAVSTTYGAGLRGCAVQASYAVQKGSIPFR